MARAFATKYQCQSGSDEVVSRVVWTSKGSLVLALGGGLLGGVTHHHPLYEQQSPYFEPLQEYLPPLRQPQVPSVEVVALDGSEPSCEGSGIPVPTLPVDLISMVSSMSRSILWVPGSQVKLLTQFKHRIESGRVSVFAACLLIPRCSRGLKSLRTIANCAACIHIPVLLGVPKAFRDSDTTVSLVLQRLDHVLRQIIDSLLLDVMAQLDISFVDVS